MEKQTAGKCSNKDTKYPKIVPRFCDVFMIDSMGLQFGE
jgi:hypothetical protein